LPPQKVGEPWEIRSLVSGSADTIERSRSRALALFFMAPV
jgi:hypothetical protein